jgi:hypothetical protein
VTKQSASKRQAELKTLRELIAKYGIVGIAEAADTVQVWPQNLPDLRGLPEPVAKVRATTIWIEAEMKDFSAEYEERRKQRAKAA